VPGTPGPELARNEASLYEHLLSLATLCVARHSYRAKYFALTHGLLSRAVPLVNARPRFVGLGAGRGTHSALRRHANCARIGVGWGAAAAALRFFRQVVGLRDAFYDRHLVTTGLWAHVLALFADVQHETSLANSALLELFAFIRMVRHPQHQHGAAMAPQRLTEGGGPREAHRTICAHTLSMWWRNTGRCWSARPSATLCAAS
jgi:hypothetical protein